MAKRIDRREKKGKPRGGLNEEKTVEIYTASSGEAALADAATAGFPATKENLSDGVYVSGTARVRAEKRRRRIKYIPVRYIISMLLVLASTLLIIAAVLALLALVDYSYIGLIVVQTTTVIYIVASDNNPDFKIPWLLAVLTLPVAGLMLYLLFAQRKLSGKQKKRLKTLRDIDYGRNDGDSFAALKTESPTAYAQARCICDIASTHLFTDTRQRYFSSGEEMCASLLADLKKAEKFIFLEYFIIAYGVLWDSVLEILKEKVGAGVDVRVVFDDIGCMMTLPGNYASILKKAGIKATVFSRVRGKTDNEFNNRSHRKIAVIDGKVGYTGGINLADEYINEKMRFGHWKDGGIRLEGQAVAELTKLFFTDYFINVKKSDIGQADYFPEIEGGGGSGYIVPFGDGPRPVYERRVGKTVIQNLLNGAADYAYITTPYLILDNELCTTIENAALRGVDVKIITPHIPDKKLVFMLTRSYYPRLMRAGVQIYEYGAGFIHAKNFLVDDKFGMIGTINLDNRSLVHHFENGVWMYGCDCLADLKADFLETFGNCIKVEPQGVKANPFKRAVCAVLRLFAPML